MEFLQGYNRNVETDATGQKKTRQRKNTKEEQPNNSNTQQQIKTEKTLSTLESHKNGKQYGLLFLRQSRKEHALSKVQQQKRTRRSRSFKNPWLCSMTILLELVRRNYCSSFYSRFSGSSCHSNSFLHHLSPSYFSYLLTRSFFSRRVFYHPAEVL